MGGGTGLRTFHYQLASLRLRYGGHGIDDPLDLTLSSHLGSMELQAQVFSVLGQSVTHLQHLHAIFLDNIHADYY
jgi:hypothetical protein